MRTVIHRCSARGQAFPSHILHAPGIGAASSSWCRLTGDQYRLTGDQYRLPVEPHDRTRSFLVELDRLVEFVQGMIERVDGRFLVTAEIGRSSLEPILDGFDLPDGALKNRMPFAFCAGGGFLPGLR